VIGCSVHELREGSGKAAACARRPCRDSGEVIDFECSAGTRLSDVSKRAWAAHARKCMRQETATEPSTGSTLEFLRIEWPGPVR